MKGIINTIGVLLIICCSRSLPAYAQTVEIHQIDVGTGDATLINIRNTGLAITHSILIDAGETNMDESVIAYLKANARTVGANVYLDYIISSHYHSDHIGGMVGHKATAYQTVNGKKRRMCGSYYTGILDAASGIRYFAVLDKGSSVPSGNSNLYTKYRTLAGNRRIAVGTTAIGNFGAINSIAAPANPPYPVPGVNQSLSLGGTIDLGLDNNNIPIKLALVLADSKVYFPGTPGNMYNVADTLGTLWNQNLRTRRDNPNNWGVGWILEYGAFRYYTAGDVGGYNSGYGTCVSCGSNYFDIETPMSNAFQAIYPAPLSMAGHICTQKISHHGSCCSSNPNFLNTLKMSMATISSGDRASFGHPTQEVLDRLQGLLWHADSLRQTALSAFLMTELHFADRNIDLARGSTSGSMSWVATNQAVNPADTAKTQIMANGQSLYFMNGTVPITDGDIVIKVYPSNNLGISISRESSYTVKYENYNGSVPSLQRTINCHGQ